MTAGKDPVIPAIAPVDFNVSEIRSVTLDGPPALMERDWMSPYVWQDMNGRLGIMVRAVPRADADKTDTGMIWAGWSEDGDTFTMLPAPAIVAGPDENQAGGSRIRPCCSAMTAATSFITLVSPRTWRMASCSMRLARRSTG